MDGEKEEGESPSFDYSMMKKWLEAGHDVVLSEAIETSQLKDQFHCSRCRENWSCPALNTEQRKEAADTMRRKNIFEQFEYFRMAGFTFAEAKRTMEHISIVPGKCNKCKRPLSDDSEQVVCRCRSLNLNW